jgi:hypothetical protein
VSKSFDDYFWSRVDKRGPDECWEWTGARIQRGYGQVNKLRKHPAGTVASRISYWLANGPFDTTLLVCHKCDRPPCVNPAHLFIGTSADNSHDMVTKGRHGRTPLTAQDVADIRASKEKQAVLAARYGVSQPSISNIRRGKHWRHVSATYARDSLPVTEHDEHDGQNSFSGPEPQVDA